MTAATAKSAATATRLREAGCVFAEEEARVLASAAGGAAELEAMVERRASGLPLEQVLGWAEFCGLRIALDPGVFAPRRRTELLVHEAGALAPAVVVDLCCGSGAVGAALAPEELYAVDIDPAAVRCARRNVRGEVYEGDLYAPLPVRLRGRVDALVASAPYVPAGELGLLPREARLHEARVALDGGADGLDVVRRVAAGAPEWLSPRGSLLIETSVEQGPLAAEAVRASGLTPRLVTCDELEASVIIAS